MISIAVTPQNTLQPTPIWASELQANVRRAPKIKTRITANMFKNLIFQCSLKYSANVTEINISG
ncbi:MAG: hypothetical protein A2017_10460 [Lentisphaerae bacterium GWF2_44_16]|nr:MAG: hypothetical protein A2017_10460 [Lentisphaerae bacterium GWF2_44_16]